MVASLPCIAPPFSKQCDRSLRRTLVVGARAALYRLPSGRAPPRYPSLISRARTSQGHTHYHALAP
jgi:hypothetical protein